MKRDSENLRDLVKRLDAVIQTAIDGIITIDSQGIVESMNRSAAELFQYTAQEVIGNNIKMLMTEPDRSSHDTYIRDYMRTKKARIIGIGREVVGKKKDGSLFPFRLAVSEVILNDRIIFTGIVHDLTDVNAAQEQLHQINESLEDQVESRTKDLENALNELLSTNQKLETSQQELKALLEKERELSDLKSRFVSLASHEFRTPLSTILSSVSLISKYGKKGLPEKQNKHVDRIKSAVGNLTGILNDFLSLSKLEEGKVEVKNSRVDMIAICKEVIDEVQGIIKEGQTIQKDIIGINSIQFSDPRIIKNIMFNLISNAIKYSGDESTIRCTLDFSSENEFAFSVQDNGIGIPESDQQYLFGRFFRASNAENIKGTGLGLNIVKKYVEMLDGQISFESKEGLGSIFEVTIPIV